MGQMAAGGVAMQNLQQEYLHGGDRREDAVAPPGIPDLAAHREDSVGLQQRGPLVREALQDGGYTRDHRVTSWTIRVLTPIHTGDARRITTSARPYELDHGFCLT